MHFFLLLFTLTAIAQTTTFQEIDPEREKHYEEVRLQKIENMKLAKKKLDREKAEKLKKQEDQRLAKEKREEEARVAKEKKDKEEREEERRAKFKEDARRGWEELLENKKKANAEMSRVQDVHTPQKTAPTPSPSVAAPASEIRSPESPKLMKAFSVIHKCKFFPGNRSRNQFEFWSWEKNNGSFGLRIRTPDISCEDAMATCLRNFALNRKMTAYCDFAGNVLAEQRTDSLR